jgi:hypothetical protein
VKENGSASLVLSRGWNFNFEMEQEVQVSDRADFYIEKVRYNKDHTRIVWVSVRQDSSSKLSGPFNMVRKKMVSLMREGKQFMTIFRNEEGKYRKGQKILVVSIKGSEYIRTDEALTEQDQLENLPEF